MADLMMVQLKKRAASQLYVRLSLHCALDCSASWADIIISDAHSFTYSGALKRKRVLGSSAMHSAATTGGSSSALSGDGDSDDDNGHDFHDHGDGGWDGAGDGMDTGAI